MFKKLEYSNMSYSIIQRVSVVEQIFRHSSVEEVDSLNVAAHKRSGEHERRAREGGANLRINYCGLRERSAFAGHLSAKPTAPMFRALKHKARRRKVGLMTKCYKIDVLCLITALFTLTRSIATI